MQGLNHVRLVYLFLFLPSSRWPFQQPEAEARGGGGRLLFVAPTPPRLSQGFILRATRSLAGGEQRRTSQAPQEALQIARRPHFPRRSSAVSVVYALNAAAAQFVFEIGRGNDPFF